jgi:hypothetical protein
MLSSPSPSSLLPAVYRRLERALIDEYARRYDDGVVLHRDEEPSDAAAPLHFRVDYQGRPELAATLSIANNDDRACTVCCSVEHGGAQRFSYRPLRASQAPTAPDPELSRLGEAMASFLLAELQKELSRLVLEGPDDPLAMM